MSFLTLLTAKYPSLQPTKKLESWHELSFADFLKEVKKQKIAWSLREESEWLEHFTAEQAAARALRQEIEKTDREIDRMVYELYGLTEAEIAPGSRGWRDVEKRCRVSTTVEW